MVLNLKKNKTYKIIITVLLVIAFIVSVAACKGVPAVVEEQPVEEEKPVVEVSNEVKEETKKETPPVVEEETPEEIEWEGIKITPIEGLRFEEGTFFAEAGNPYGLEVGEKAGVFVKDAVEINGEMESSIGLRPEVIEVIQKEIMEKEKEFRYPLPFNLEEAKGIKIREVLGASRDEEGNLSFDYTLKDYGLAVEAPIGTKLYSPLESDRYQIGSWQDFYSDGREAGTQWVFDFHDLFKEDKFNEANIDARYVSFNAGDVKFYPPKEEGKEIEEMILYEIKTGELIAEVTHEAYFYSTDDESRFDPPGQYQFLIGHSIWSEENYYNLRVIEYLLSIQDLKVFIYPAQ